ncbi:MAG: histidine phosphatase family protein [candidate division KSB1 bacterium]|nr:histidine phosphatase family protein [candidate division KSB1 bacterium]
MKRLLIIRHAHAELANHDISDLERPLSDKGERDARFLSELLRDQYPDRLDLILTSPARRAGQTAQIIAQEIGVDEQKIQFRDSIYCGSMEGLFNLICYADDSISSVMLIGHNPQITFLANQLSPCSIETIPPAGAVILDFDIDSWSRLFGKKAVSHFVINPDKF